jgi:hypothetical protein
MKAIRKKNGNVFYACPDKLWKIAFEKWQGDTNGPCPMPERHLMFNGMNDRVYNIVEHFEYEIPLNVRREEEEL